jgi:hypothetical protein
MTGAKRVKRLSFVVDLPSSLLVQEGAIVREIFSRIANEFRYKFQTTSKTFHFVFIRNVTTIFARA